MQLLDGIKVLELGSYITAPFCGTLLGDFGADVVKVESPEGGDPFRTFRGRLYSPHFVAFNKNKRSVTLDLRSPEGRTALFELIDCADVLLENFRPGVVERMGLGWGDIHARNPRLIHCSITGFGTHGPYRSRPAFDTVVSALSGFLGTSLDPDNPVLAGATVGDNVGAITACYGILAALFERERSGVGRRLEVDMLEALIAFSPSDAVGLSRTGALGDRFSRPAASQSWTLRCADGKILAIHLSSPDKFWMGLVNAFERTDLATDPRFGARQNRVENYLALGAELQAIAATRPRSHWVARLEEHEVPYAPVYQADEVLADPQVQALGTFYSVQHPSEGDVLIVRRPVYVDGERPSLDRPAPTLGEHNDEIFAPSGVWRQTAPSAL